MNSDKDIIESIRRGDKDQYAELVRRYQARIISLCLGFLSDPTQAQDAAQDIFVNAYHRLNSFRGESSFGTWIYRIASNFCLDILRKRKRERTESLEELIEENKESLNRFSLTNLESENRLENQDLIRSVLKSLPEKDRVLLLLRESQGLTYSELSQVLDCSMDAVKARLKRARKSIKKIFRHYLDLENV